MGLGPQEPGRGEEEGGLGHHMPQQGITFGPTVVSASLPGFYEGRREQVRQLVAGGE